MMQVPMAGDMERSESILWPIFCVCIVAREVDGKGGNL